jgi:hypothetical protein
MLVYSIRGICFRGDRISRDTSKGQAGTSVQGLVCTAIRMLGEPSLHLPLQVTFMASPWQFFFMMMMKMMITTTMMMKCNFLFLRAISCVVFRLIGINEEIRVGQECVSKYCIKAENSDVHY